MEFYQQDVKEALKSLETSNSGLSSTEAKNRLERYGYNEVKQAKGPSALQIFFEQFKSPLVIILLAATVLSVILGEYIDASIIFVIIVLNAILGLYQEYRAEKSIDALKKMQALKAIVLRDGKKVEIDARELVPGDIVVIEEGSKIPADSRLIEVINLQTVEGSLTGESTPVSKHSNVIEKAQISEMKNMVFSGTNATRGRATGVVAATGMNTQIGKIAGMIENTEDKQTPLQMQLSSLGKYLGIIILIIATIVFATELLEYGQFDKKFLVEQFIIAVSLAVAAIPEGLPAVVTIGLALGVQKMIKRNALVRKLPAIETLGSTSVICSDKTGTLTHNEMTVKEIYCNNKLIKVSGEGYDTKGEFYYDNKPINPKELKLTLDIARLCNNASIIDGKNVGDPTEIALLVAAEKASIRGDVARVGEIPFESEKKYMATMHHIGGKKISYFKGAPEIILKMSSKINHDGRVNFLTKQERDKIIKANDSMAQEALRVLAVAYKEGAGEKDLIFVGLMGMIDPPRAEVKEAIKKCKEAGIRVVMITGDHKMTALAVGHEIGIEGKAIIGEEIDAMDDKMLAYEAETVNIYARVSPEHKVKILEAIRKNGNLVIAMTGDGVNDAPALKDADIGVAMGITGTDVAREASDMVLTDDNFASIVNAVEEGRGVFDNIKKFVLYLLSCNIAEVMIIFFALILGWPLPLVAIQLLWLNLVTDGLPAIALGLDPARKDIMKLMPRRRDEKILSKRTQLHIFLSGALITAGVLTLFYHGMEFGLDKARTIAFTGLVMFEMIRIYEIRSDYKLGFFSNKWLLAAVASSIGLQLAVVYIPVINTYFKSVPLNLADWGLIAIVGSGVIVGNMIIWLIRKKVINRVMH